MIDNMTSTKTLAKRAGVTTAALNEAARDLSIAMTYDHTNRCWRVASRHDATQLVSLLSEG